MSSTLPPVPYRAPVVDANGMLSPIWSDWFRAVFLRAGGNIAETNDELYEIGPGRLQADAVDTASIANGAVTGPKLAAAAVGTANIDTAAVTALKIAADAVETAAIKNDNVTFAKLLTTDWLKSNASTGYQKFGSGIILQWGSASAIASGAVGSQLFATSFPNACRQVIACITGNSATATTTTGGFGVGNFSTGGFDIYNRMSVAQAFDWIAVGY